MNTITQILSVFHLVHIPDRNFNHPFGNSVTDTTTPPRAKKDNPDNLRLTKDKGIPVLVGHQDEWDLVGQMKEQMHPGINEKDLSIIESNKMDIDKYRTIKADRANGMSISEIAKKHKGVYGMGKRTVAKYVSSINAANEN